LWGRLDQTATALNRKAARAKRGGKKGQGAKCAKQGVFKDYPTIELMRAEEWHANRVKKNGPGGVQRNQ